VGGQDGTYDGFGGSGGGGGERYRTGPPPKGLVRGGRGFSSGAVDIQDIRYAPTGDGGGNSGGGATRQPQHTRRRGGVGGGGLGNNSKSFHKKF
jgi:hypothetical protein